MKRFLLTLIVLSISVVTAVIGQSQQNESLAFKAGYVLGIFLGIIWPFIIIAIAAYAIYRFVKKKKATAKV